MEMIDDNHFLCHFYCHFSAFRYIGTFSRKRVISLFLKLRFLNFLQYR